MMHTIGFMEEHMRNDRDDHVRETDLMCTKMGCPVGNFDYYSIMMYSKSCSLTYN